MHIILRIDAIDYICERVLYTFAQREQNAKVNEDCEPVYVGVGYVAHEGKKTAKHHQNE